MTRWHVAVTRDEPEDGALSQALSRQGFTARHCPVFEAQAPRDQAPLQEAAVALEAFDLVVFSSARAVTRARSTPWPAGLRTAAVGPRTAGAIARLGVAAPAIVGDGDGAAALWAVLAAGQWQGRRVLLPAAAEGLSLIATHLRAAGAAVEEVAAYRMVRRSPDDIEASWTAANPDAVVIASPAVAPWLIEAIGWRRWGGWRRSRPLAQPRRRRSRRQASLTTCHRARTSSPCHNCSGRCVGRDVVTFES